jgi:tight adherence protein B
MEAAPMTLFTALLSGACVYLAVGFITGYAPDLQFRTKARPQVSDRQLWLIQAGSDLTPRQFWAGSIFVAFVAFLLALVVSGAWWLAVVPAIGALLFPRAYYGRRRAARLEETRAAWPDGLRDMLASISAGATLSNALTSLAATGPEPLRDAFERFPLQARMLGVVPALELVKEELGDATSDKVIEVLILAYRHGGDLTEIVMRDLVEEITEDLRVEREIRTQGLEQRLEGRVVTVVPWAMLIFLAFVPGPYQDFYRSTRGLAVVVIGAFWSVMGLFFLRWLNRREAERRVLGGSAVVAAGDR